MENPVTSPRPELPIAFKSLENFPWEYVHSNPDDPTTDFFFRDTETWEGQSPDFIPDPHYLMRVRLGYNFYGIETHDNNPDHFDVYNYGSDPDAMDPFEEDPDPQNASPEEMRSWIDSKSQEFAYQELLL